ncbi:apses-domain-containing protein [Rhizopus microsporus var. microsporus]|uniref:Apses-domain-containing protein n=1 Tax=Rhizopus microsporus var. microsporus TaxID=86635 RepID=A0A1X0QYG2_RHIZD|nr:apses-domain-containing protein [Rhizopus microsporus var. microsporus]
MQRKNQDETHSMLVSLDSTSSSSASASSAVSESVTDDKEHWQERWPGHLVRATLPTLPPVHSHLQYSPYPLRMHRPRLTATLWEDESTLCYQVDTRGICVARRQDNNMINGTKLLNVAGMSRGKRDGILKNERGRVVVKVGAMHLKGVWIPFARAKTLATQFNILDALYPIFADDPVSFLYPSHFYQLHNGPAINPYQRGQTESSAEVNNSISPVKQYPGEFW